MKRKLIVPISPELLKDLLGLPDDVVADDVKWDFERNSIMLKLKGPMLPEVAEAQPIPHGEFRLADDGWIELIWDGGALSLRRRL